MLGWSGVGDQGHLLQLVEPTSWSVLLQVPSLSPPDGIGSLHLAENHFLGLTVVRLPLTGPLKDGAPVSRGSSTSPDGWFFGLVRFFFNLNHPAVVWWTSSPNFACAWRIGPGF